MVGWARCSDNRCQRHTSGAKLPTRFCGKAGSLLEPIFGAKLAKTLILCTMSPKRMIGVPRTARLEIDHVILRRHHGGRPALILRGAKRFFAYCKVERPPSVEKQRELCRTFVAAQGGAIVDEAFDVGAGAVVDMPGYARLRAGS